MPIDVAAAVGAALPPTEHQWSDQDVILYNLAVGAGVPPTDQRELAYAYEANLRAIPSYGTIPPFQMMMALGSVDGLDISLADILHGEHELLVTGDIPTHGRVSQSGRIVDVFDRRRGALVVVEVESTLDGGNRPLFVNRASIYVRGEGGFGGDPGPPRSDDPPDRPPDLVSTSVTLPQQALLYRMASRDLNPLHADPGFAAFAGFERPILHGLCTYGFATKAVVDGLFDGDTTRFGRLKARFAGHVFPGETLVTSIWRDDSGAIVQTHVEERGAIVLSNARVEERR